jgi:GNAT superfamily N-acetyltransferase
VTVTIRLALPADAAVLAQLRYDFRAFTAPPTEPEPAFVARCTHWMAEALRSPRWLAWIADLNGTVAGNLWLQAIEKLPNPGEERERHAYITNAYVAPAQRGGIGRLLLETALAWCRANGVDSVVLWPTAGSRTLYARHGFAVRDDLMEAVLDDARLGAD